MRRHIKRIFFYGALALIPIVALIILDVITGNIGETKEIRNASRMFRSEAVPLFLKTKNLFPNIEHRYLYGSREDPRHQGDPGSARIFRTDNFGTIVSGPETHDVPSERRILFLGGSTTECNEVDEEFRFPGLVGKLLSDAAVKPFKGVNLGVRGNTSRDSVNLLLNHPAARTAKTVVLMHNINDRLLLAIRGNYDAPIDGPAPTKWSAVSSSVKGTWASLLDFLSHRSNLFFLLRSKVFDVNPWTGERIEEGTIDEENIDFKDAQLEKSIEEFRISLRTFIAVTRAMGKRPVLMTQALGRKSESQKEFNQVTRTIAAEGNVTLIDIEETLDGIQQGLFLSDDIHLNNEGSRVIAKIVTDILASQVFDLDVSGTSHTDVSLVPDFSICRPPGEGSSAPATSTKHLLIRQSGRYPVLSYDGRWLLYQKWTGNREVVKLFNMKDGTTRMISDPESTAVDRHATFLWSAKDHLKIVFARKINNVERLYITAVDSNAVVPLALPPLMSASIPATNDDTIFFAGNQTGSDDNRLEPVDLYRWQDGALEKLTTTPWEQWRPAPDPSGRYLFHIANKDGQFDIARMDITTKETITFYGTDADEWDPDASPDGKWLVFASKESGDWDLVIAPIAAPNKAVKLTEGDADDWDPRFTSDSRVIVFASKAPGAPPFMYFVCPFGEYMR